MLLLSIILSIVTSTTPATRWLEAYPVGNGRSGMMVYGGTDVERLALNESTLWGGEVDEGMQRPFGKERLRELQQIFLNQDFEQGNAIAHRYLEGNIRSFGTHLPMGEVVIRRLTDTPAVVEAYSRRLSLDSAIVLTSWKQNTVTYTTCAFSSYPDQVMVYHWTASQPQSLDVGLDLMRPSTIEVQPEGLLWHGQVNFPLQGRGGVHFIGQVRCVTDGICAAQDSSLRITNATQLTLLMDIRTDYSSPSWDGSNYWKTCTQTLNAASQYTYAELLTRHVTDYQPLYRRTQLCLPDDKQTETYFNFARYLFISASRVGMPLPIALQGFYNDNRACNMGWTNDYHLDINTQQNYWLSGPGNLADGDEPLIRYISDLAYYGQSTAQQVYGCRGWCAHTTANVWGFTAPSAYIGWGLFPLAGSWLATHLWSHYEYTQDTTFLRTTAYPILKSNAQFLLDYMIRDKQGYLLTGPSISPENGFLWKGQAYCASMMPTVDRVLSYEIFSSIIHSTDILHIDSAFADTVRQALADLPPLQISKRSTLQEWYDDVEDAYPNHRHTSHLLALYPYDQINYDLHPDLCQAALMTIHNRQSRPDWEDAEWSRANMLLYEACLRRGEKAYSNLTAYYDNLMAPNGFSLSPAGLGGAEDDIFAIDGVTAIGTGIAEMLLHSRVDYTQPDKPVIITLLPALPKQWKSGSVKGLSAKGNITVNITWKNGKIKHYDIIPANPQQKYQLTNNIN